MININSIREEPAIDADEVEYNGKQHRIHAPGTLSIAIHITERQVLLSTWTGLHRE